MSDIERSEELCADICGMIDILKHSFSVGEVSPEALEAFKNVYDSCIDYVTAYQYHSM